MIRTVRDICVWTIHTSPIYSSLIRIKLHGVETMIKNPTHWTFKSAGVYLCGGNEVADPVFAGERWRNLCLCLCFSGSCVVTDRPGVGGRRRASSERPGRIRRRVRQKNS